MLSSDILVLEIPPFTQGSIKVATAAEVSGFVKLILVFTRWLNDQLLVHSQSVAMSKYFSFGNVYTLKSVILHDMKLSRFDDIWHWAVIPSVQEFVHCLLRNYDCVLPSRCNKDSPGMMVGSNQSHCFQLRSCLSSLQFWLSQKEEVIDDNHEDSWCPHPAGHYCPCPASSQG